jgi:phosphate transport system substrate-binding protein
MMRIVFSIFTTLLMLGCGGNKEASKFGATDTPVKGKITIAADESLKRIIDAEVDIYKMTYPNTQFNVIYTPENKAIKMMLEGDARIAAVTRELNDLEKGILQKEGYPTRNTIIAIEGIALITNKNSSFNEMSMEELGKIMNGEKKIQVGFDESNSSNLNFLINKFKVKDIKKANVSAAKSTDELIDFVSRNPNMIGVIGMSWISDKDSKKADAIKAKVKVLPVSKDGGKAYPPDNYSIDQRKYPLERLAYLHIKESHWGLGRGFQKFVCSQRGQLIIEKEGIQPFYMFDKQININTEPIEN